MVNNKLPIPQSRVDCYLNAIATKDNAKLPIPQSRVDCYLNAIATKDNAKLPIPQSRVDYYLNYIALNSSISGAKPEILLTDNGEIILINDNTAILDVMEV